MTEKELSQEDLELLRKARAERDKEAAKQAKAEREKEYKTLVNQMVNEAIPKAQELHDQMAATKKNLVETFKTIIDMKNELYGGTNKAKEGRYTDTFTNEESSARVTVGFNMLDYYDDTHTAGIDKLKEYLSSFASDEKSQTLVQMVETLLSERTKGGQLKAQNVLRLEKMAAESGDELFIEAMEIIRNAYHPSASKQFVKVEVKDEHGTWMPIPLSLTDC